MKNENKYLYQMTDWEGDHVGLLSTNAESEEVQRIWSKADIKCVEDIVEELMKEYPGTERIFVDDEIYP